MIRFQGGLSVLPREIRSRIATVVDPPSELNATQLDRLQKALHLVTPETLESVRYVVIGTFSERASGLHGFAVGNALALQRYLVEESGEREGRLEFTVIHELAHTYDAYLGRSTAPRAIDAFLAGLDPESAAAARQKIRDRIRARRFDRSLRDTFIDVMNTANELGLANETFCGDLEPVSCWRNKNERAYAAGIATPYGLSTPAEDVASWVHTTHGLPASRIPQAHLCSELRSARDLSTRGHLLAYIKLAILRGVRAITDETFRGCVGNFPIPHADRKGIFLYWQSDQTVLPLSQDVQAGWSVVDGTPMFSVLASTADMNYRALIQVLAPAAGRFPSRLATLADINVVTVEMPLSGFFLSHATEPGLARGSQSGIVAFTELSRERVEGLIFFLKLQSDLHIVTDTFEVGTFLWTP
ncbi:MAG: hypothetical protein R3F60_31920 [bacterium]